MYDFQQYSLALHCFQRMGSLHGAPEGSFIAADKVMDIESFSPGIF